MKFFTLTSGCVNVELSASTSQNLVDCRGIELIITEQVKKIRKTLANISEIDHVENSTHERLKEIRQSMGKGKKKRLDLVLMNQQLV